MLCALLLLSFGSCHHNESDIKVNVKIVGELPQLENGAKNQGIAGAFSRIVNDKLIVAGGANFPDALPREGGTKVFYKKGYVFEIGDDTLMSFFEPFDLPDPVAYGCSVSLPEGVLCIGGNDQGKCFSKVYLIGEDENSGALKTTDFPDLPVPLSFASAVVFEDNVYIVGGSSLASGEDSGSYFFKLDLAKRNANNFAWEKLPPFQGPGRIYPVVVVQSNGNQPCIYLFSGRNVPKDGAVKVFDDGMYYDPVTKVWMAIGKNNSLSFPVMAGSAFPYGANDIVFLYQLRCDFFSCF